MKPIKFFFEQNKDVHAENMPIKLHTLKYDLLANKPEWLKLIAEWNQEQWGYLRPGTDVNYFIDRFQAYLNKTTLPLIYVAYFEDSQQPIGMFALTEDTYDMGYKDQKVPMLNNVYVMKEYRGQGIGIWLTQLAEEKAQELGYNKIFLFTSDDSLNEYYKKLDWTLQKQSSFLEDKKDVWIFDKSLKPKHDLTNITPKIKN